MLILNSNSLNERHKEFNTKVNEAALKEVDFEQVKNETEQSDIDTLFKIDLASKYKNIGYIIEVLKSGDALHISRAFKCTWMYDEQFSHLINVDYLHHNVFPFMSIKMKNKLLTTISNNIRDTDRATAFCDYCLKMNLTNIVLKFMPYTHDDYKFELLKNSNVSITLDVKNGHKHIIGNSFTFADAYIKTLYGDTHKLKVFIEISYLYSLSDVQYLDILEKHVDIHPCSQIRFPRFGLRISKDILTKHRNRVVTNPPLYVNILNKASMAKYMTPENAIECLSALTVEKYWNYGFCNSYEYLLNIIPEEQRFEFIKKIFRNKFPDQQFEMDIKFYTEKYFRFMTTEQKNKWGLDQIASKNEILGVGNDYKWYQFVNFEKAFDDLKKLIMITPDMHKRSDMVNILLDSAKTQRDLEIIFKYFYERHNNEQRMIKERFLDLVAYKFNVYEFDQSCWDAFNKIYQNLDVYSMLDSYQSRTDYKIIAFIYHVINNIEVHDALKLFIDTKMYFYTMRGHREKISKEKQKMVYEYLYNWYIDKINELAAVPYEEEVKQKLRKYLSYFLDILREFEKTKNDIPDVVTKLMKLDWDQYSRHQLFYEPVKKFTQDDLLRLLKKDAKLVVEKLPLIKSNIDYNFKYPLSQLLRKLKLYFSNDISKQYLDFYSSILSGTDVKPKIARAACYGIFHLAEDNFKVDFMTKYAPTQSKINRSEIDESLLNIQEAICRTALYSRPPVPLENMLIYVKGDYVPSCLPMFNAYSANLPLPLCMKFIEAILNKPVSIQKHGLRLAFAYFNAENLKNLVLSVWKKTKNVSLRLIIYKALYSKILDGDETTKGTLFDTLQMITLDLREDDTDIFTHWQSVRSLQALMSDYIKTLWTAVCALPDSNMKRARMVEIIQYMSSNIQSIHQDLIQDHVDGFIKNVFVTEDSIKTSFKTDIDKSKWDLTINFISYVQNKDVLAYRLELCKLILIQCSSRFNIIDDNIYVMRRFFSEFIKKLLYRGSLYPIKESYEYLNVIYETVLEMIQDSFVLEDIYMIIWAIQINLKIRKALFEIATKSSTVNDNAMKNDIVRDEMLNFGKSIGTLIAEFSEKNVYFNMFASNIQEELVSNVQTTVERNRSIVCEISPNDVYILISVALLSFKTNDMYIFALNILPTTYWPKLIYLREYKIVLDELKGLNDPEIKCLIYNKYVHSDFTPKEFLQL